MNSTKTAPGGAEARAAQIAQRLNPFPWYQTMRQAAPVYYDARMDGWHAFRYNDVQRVLSESATFSSEFRQDGDDPVQPLAASIVGIDPPRHRQLRALVTQAFTPRTVARLEARITAIVDEHLAAVLPQGHMDVVADLAYPLPVIVIAELLGIPAADRDRFKHWSDLVVTGGDTLGNARDAGGAARTMAAMQDMSAYFVRMMELRRADPRDDLISQLLGVQIDGVHLTPEELLGFCTLLLVAGNETTTNLIANAILCFDENPAVVAGLQRDPSGLPDTIEEVLRYRSPVQSMFRRAKGDAELGGQAIRAGQTVIAWIGSANRDETQFADADRFDPQRPNLSRHIAFGYGIHYCLGAPLARLESRIGLGAMLARMGDLQRVREEALLPINSMVVWGVQRLPITFRAL